MQEYGNNAHIPNIVDDFSSDEPLGIKDDIWEVLTACPLALGHPTTMIIWILTFL